MKFKHNDIIVPKISGSKKGGTTITPNSLFSTDILFVTNAFGEGPVYRINPNGPQDIEINDNKIDDLIHIDGNGGFDLDKFAAIATPGTITQRPLPLFGEAIVTPQAFSSPVKLKKGNIDGIPSSSISEQETSAADIDSLRFTFIIDELYRGDDKGNIYAYNVSILITITDYDGSNPVTIEKTFSDKTDTAYKFSIQYNLSSEQQQRSEGRGYKFSIEKTSDDSSSPKIRDIISFAGWDEIIHDDQAYPRTALIGYGIKAADEHTGGVPNFTSLIKGLLVKVPANYNQPILSTGEIDWRQLEVAETGDLGYTTAGYLLQQSGTGTVLYDSNPVIYNGVWDGTFVYSWTQNPVWIIYDLLTNDTYGLGIPEENIDKYKFYQIAQYCDACDPNTGQFIGVDGLSDGTFRNKPRGYRTEVREVLLGLTKGTAVKERRFITDISITENEQALDIINKITSTFRALLTYAGGKITMAVDMPEEYPVMLFNDVNIKSGSLQISGVKESDTITGVDVSYMEPDNHYKREVLRINGEEANDGTESSDFEKISSLDLKGVTRRSQAMRTGQYQLAASKYVKRMVSFEAGPDAVYLAPGDLIAVSTNSSGIVYGYGGKIHADSAVDTIGNTSVYLEHFTSPPLSDTTFTSNTYPLALRILKTETDKLDIYLLSNTDYSLTTTGNVISGADYARVSIIQKFDPITRTFSTIDSLTSDISPEDGDLWSVGEFENINNYYTSKTDKLFKVTEVNRDPKEYTVGINAIEYISNVYEDSDTFINYNPVQYTQVQSPILTPPTPFVKIAPALKQDVDGTVRADVSVETTTIKDNYTQKFTTEHYVSYPTSIQHIESINSYSPYTFTLSSTQGFSVGDKVTITGRNGYSSDVGKVSLMCTAKALQGAASIKLTLSGLDLCTNPMTGNNILEDYAITNQQIIAELPVATTSDPDGEKNFIGYASNFETISVVITSFDLLTNSITITNTDNQLLAKLPNGNFCVSLRQVINPAFIPNTNCFFVTASPDIHIQEGELQTGLNTIDLQFKPRTDACVTMYVDGALETDYTLNRNISLGIPANVQYTALASDYFYRLESNHFSVPGVEIGDSVYTHFDNVYTITDSTFDPESASYNAAMTSNSIFMVYTNKPASSNLSTYKFINITEDPVGIITDISANNVTINYNDVNYSNTFNLANAMPYYLSTGDNYERVFLTNDNYIYNAPLGNVSVKSRNRTVVGRVSPFVTNRTFLEELPIRKVNNLAITESLYREQTGGIAVRVTCSFDHIQNQQVSEYEIGYKINYNVEDTIDYAEELSRYNTVQVSAQGVDEDGRIRFSIPNINRGDQSEANSIEFRVVPLNKNIRGIPAFASKNIVGKTAKPANVKAFTGGQQTDQVTLFWEYERNNVTSELVDIDLKEVVIYRVLGDYSTYSGEQLTELFYLATPLVTVAAGSQRKSVPIDNYGTYTYLVKTKDTSGNFSESTVATTITTSRPKRNTVVQAFNEDDPATNFTEIDNANASEYYYPSFANTVTGGISDTGATSVDLANGSSEGYDTTINLTDLIATDDATYITQIRDFGIAIHGSVNLAIELSQIIQSTYNDQKVAVYDGVSEVSSVDSILVDEGIGNFLINQATIYGSGAYNADNKTYVTGSDTGPGTNVWAVWNYGQFVGDTSNANSYALIAGVINANAIALGETYFANGNPTGSNSFANITSVASSYTLVDLRQYKDTSTADTYQGDLSATSTQTFIRTSTADSVYYANGNVNVQAFDSSAVNDGFIPYEAGSRPIRHYQLKHVVINNEPGKYDVILDKFRYSLEKEQTVFTKTVSYDSSPTTINYANSAFVYRPVISYTILDQVDAEANPVIAVTTAASPTEASFKLYASDGSGAYAANSTANVMVTVIGV